MPEFVSGIFSTTSSIVLMAAGIASIFELDPVSKVTGIPGWYLILGIKCSDTTGVRLVY